MAGTFNAIPIEVNQMIAHNLEYDSDVCNFRLICHATRNAIDGDYGTYWRVRFLSAYDPLTDPTKSDGRNANEVMRKTYQERRCILRRGATFTYGQTRAEQRCLILLRDLVLDSFSGGTTDKNGERHSLNMEAIQQFVANHEFLHNVLFTWPRKASRSSPRHRSRDTCNDDLDRVQTPHPFLHTMQVLLTHLFLEVSSARVWHFAQVWSFAESQKAVYACAEVAPIFGGVNGAEIDMHWILHNANFWKYHMNREEEATLHEAMAALVDVQRPGGWKAKIETGVQSVGKYWKGSYAYLGESDMNYIRSEAYDESHVLPDNVNDDQDDGFQSLEISSIDPAGLFWPTPFASALPTHTAPKIQPRTRAQRRSLSPVQQKPFAFSGFGDDNEETFNASGWLTPMPHQHGIPGWQKMQMMKYYDDGFGGIAWDALWAYEGVVLPGGQIMLGRWWNPDRGTGERQYSGPFLMWNVDAAVEQGYEGRESEAFDAPS